jgi:alkanesulfonate monooxygenase SsuD/methylene tetrahydromethanopterin reductase-like flavin-dependent oxidoreductase (luciferase family)
MRESLPTRTASLSERIAMYNGNALKIGVFGANCSSARTATTVPERWSASWPDCLALTRLADDAGIDFMLPIGRWKGYGGDTGYQDATLETVTWACGLLAATERITVFGTVHAPLFHPIIAAKQMVTADHIGEGRFGLNIVVGWNEDEFEMFGVEQRAHALRYEYAQDWLDAIKLMWSDGEDFDFDGKHIKLKKVRAKPKPFGGERPVIMNAGASPVGRDFAVRNCDAFFMQSSRESVEETAQRVAAAKAEAAKHGREIGVFTVGVIICRPTMKEADEYHHYVNVEQADWSAVDYLLAMRNITPETVPHEEFMRRRSQYAHGNSGVPIIGDPDHIAAKLIELTSAGLAGIAVSLVNYADELPYFRDEVLPRLERVGLRLPTPATV